MAAPGKGWTNEVITTTVVHHRIHQGTFFATDAFDTALADNAFLQVLLRPGSRTPHIRHLAHGGGDMILRLYEGATFSAAGSALTAVNKNRRSSRTAQMQLSTGPTITDKGTVLSGILLPGGTGGFFGGGSPGGEAAGFEEWVLDPELDYLVELENIAGTAQPAHLQIDFYEPPEQEGAPFP